MRIGFADLLTLLFVAFKLAGVISWSWWLVLLPSIIALILRAIILALAD